MLYMYRYIDLLCIKYYFFFVVIVVKMFVNVFSYNLIIFLWKEFLKILIYIVIVDEFGLFVMYIRLNVIFVVIRSGIVYLFLFVVVIVYILVFFRLLLVNLVKVFLIISIINEVIVLVFLVLGKRKFKF